MARELQAEHRGWIEALGLPQIARTLGLAIRPSKLGLAFIAIILTLLWGWILDFAWTRAGGIGDDAIARYIVSVQTGIDYQEPEGQSGIFAVYRDHVTSQAVTFLRAAIFIGASAPGPGRALSSLLYGTSWLLLEHFFFFLLFGIGALLIWSLLGGALCRMCALQMARDEHPGVRDAIGFAREHFFGGFFLAPCVPIAFALVTAVIMILGGMLLRVPILGDFVGGPIFFLAIIGGFCVTILLVGFVVGGSLFWPTVAAEGSDAFDAFSRGLSYALSKPWKTVIYGVLMILFAAVCWLVARAFTYGSLLATRIIVGFGTSPFGWWSRGTEETAVGKLELLWPVPTADTWYVTPNWEQLAWFESFSAFLIGVYVLIVVGLLWAFLCSFYFAGSTVLYFLLRRDVDGVELEDVYIEEPFVPAAADSAATTPAASSAPPPTGTTEPGHDSARDSSPGGKPTSDD